MKKARKTGPLCDLRGSPNHRGVRGKVAMRRIARRLDRDCLAAGVRRQAPFADQIVENAVKERGKAGVEAQFQSPE